MAEVKVSALTALTGANVANGDELLINDVGSPNVSKKITADELAQATQFSSRYAPKADDRIWLPVHAGPFDGSPTLTIVGTTPVLRLDASTNEGLALSCSPPSWWSTYNVDIYWTNSGTGSGNVVWYCSSTPSLTDGNTPANAFFFQTAATAAPAQNVVKVTRGISGATATAGAPLSFIPVRFASNADDTLANDAGLYGLMLTRAS